MPSTREHPIPEWEAPPQEAVAGLMEHVRGQVLRPQDRAYDTELAGYNRISGHRPALIVVALSDEHVRVAVEFARAWGLPVGVQATGHGPAADTAGGLLLSTRHMRSVSVDPVSRTARAAAGAQWHQVIASAAHHGLAPLNGSSPTAGVVGYTLGGGLGLMVRKYGYAADHVSRIEVVTADGEHRTVTPTQDPGLFWALRGGKGNFGVVTALEFGLVPVPRLYGGGLFYPGELAAEAVHLWRGWTRTLPEEMTSSLALLRLPDVPETPEPLRGRLTVHVRVAYAGPPDEGARLVEPLRTTLTPMLDTVADIPYTAVGDIHMDPEGPQEYHQNSLMLADLSFDAAQQLLALAGHGAACDDYVVELRHLGGAAGRAPAQPSAVGHRDAGFALTTISPPAAPGERRPEPLTDAMAPWGTGLKYANFLAGPDTADCVPAAYDSATYTRLAQVKAAYDPHNVFRLNHNIPPAPAPAPSD
ncbi:MULTISPECIES: FAD-binding oxidoreductase [unclassified Streptomyces]|uniref:FAD-binding oxidoreductase n=1 Tax=unclassified Streptomyces TaxID=2593676 RepID=UPI002E0FD83F|nr:FAD-binding oxidoreductase [Streptomyces sp. NBC_01186]WSS44992.1 FAD-binding oxidoreductase [Streptomyces sp. NBC_01187]